MEQATIKREGALVEPVKKEAEVIDLVQRRREKKESEIKKEYGEIFNFRESCYERDVAKDKSKETMFSNLKIHNEIVLNYAFDLIESERLSKEDGAAAIIAVIMHDSGKLSSDLLKHHEKGVEYARKMFEEIEEKIGKIEGVEITQDFKRKVFQAIERHMNHPFLVVLNGGKKFPMPENNVDNVVFDTDMLANIGFKNVAFRLDSEKDIGEDKKEAVKNGTSIIEECFKNVTQGAAKLKGEVLSVSARDISEERIKNVNKIFNYLKEKEVFEAVQEEIFKISRGLNMDGNIIKKNAPLIKKLLNEKIYEAARASDIDLKIAGKLIM
ncbi:MAG: hypothetical protein COS71_04110 [Candidatus Moranbacteria bacterium CG06_land_8_20_14_3_00_40_12]|nr:MAG: hypothetical protein COS71_04110 [Candidatus Moranbacteria bacterium CG06_land_8_20_14_3_00_40_12]